MKIVTIVGARPQFVKAAAVCREMKRYSDIDDIMVHTGQHFDENMSEIFFEELNITPPKYNLEINSLSHGAMTGKMLEEIEKILILEKPDWVLVYGDTNSTLAGALAAAKLGMKIAHVEAGLRSFNMAMPEEINRILTDRISNILFCPTQVAIENLKKEGYDNHNVAIHNTGDVMQDAALFFSQKNINLESIDIPEKFVLATIHRAENTNSIEILKNIIEGLNEVHLNTPVVMPLHPRTKSILAKNNLDAKFIFIEPVGYMQMVTLIKKSELIITDSGGLQKEAFFFSKPCVTVRNETEWVELLDIGANVLSKPQEIYTNFQTMNSRKIDFSKRVYGDGDASKLIIDHLINFK